MEAGSCVNMTVDTNSISKAYYDERFGASGQELNEEERIRWDAIRAAIEGLNKNDLNIADFGCGRGWLSGKLSGYGTVTGFDLSEKAIENAKRSFPTLKFISLDASGKLPSNCKGAFDLVV